MLQTNIPNINSPSLHAMKKKAEKLLSRRITQSPNESISTLSGNSVSTVPPLRQRTATLSRRNTYNGKIPVNSRYLKSNGRTPNRSISDDSNASSSSNSSSEAMTPYKQAAHNLNSDERWKKEIALGTRVGFYRLYRDLGKGNFSRVKVAVHWLTKEKVAVKIIDKSKLQAKTKRMLSKEISAMESVCHPHIIRLFEVLDTPSKLYLAMEYAEGGELFYRISSDGRLPEKDAKVMFAQVTSAVIHMHHQNIVHRDLKAENVFISGPNYVKVGDFGFSTHLNCPDQTLATFCGSPPYAAPELFLSSDYIGPSVDLWSLGVLLFLMVTATLPFKGETLPTVRKQVLSGRFTVPKHVSNECNALIVGLLQQDQAKRFTANQIKSSDWLKGVIFPDSNKERKKHLTAEKETKKGLEDLGITEELLREHESKGVKSNVIGTYRIALHKIERDRVQKKVGHKRNTDNHKGNAFCPTLQSKTCVIV